MPRFKVTVRYEQRRELSIGARDVQAAKEKAEEIVSDWDGVTHAEATEAESE